MLVEQHESYLDYVKDQEENSIEIILKNLMEQYFSNLFEDVKYERSLSLLLSLVELDILKQSKFTDNEVSIKKDIALEKIFRQRNLREYVAMDLLEKHSSN